MSTVNSAAPFNPTRRVMDPPNRPDQIAESVLASLSRGRWGYRGRPWGVIKTAVLSFFTLGLLPLLCWPRRMRNFMQAEQQQLWQLAEWMRLRTGKPEALVLRDESARDLAPGPLSGAIQIVVAVMAVVAFVHLAADRSFDFPRLWGGAWGVRFHGRVGFFYEPYWAFWRQWSLLLSAGYLVYWLSVCHHAGMLEQYVEKFNALTAAEGIQPVRVAGVGLGINLAWGIFALIGLSRGAIWMIPLALAGVVQARYVWVTSRETRAALADRVRIMLQSSRPVLDVRTTPRASSRPCVNEKCGAPLRAGAAFCPRCGAHTT